MSDGNLKMNKRASAAVGTGGFGELRPGDLLSVDLACRDFLERRGLRTEASIQSEERTKRIMAERRARA